MTTVAEIMSRDVVSVSRAALIPEIARTMAKMHVREAFVLDDSRPLGVISDIDLMAGEWLATDEDSFEVLRTTTAESLMTAPIRSIGPRRTDRDGRPDAERHPPGPPARL